MVEREEGKGEMSHQIIAVMVPLFLLTHQLFYRFQHLEFHSVQLSHNVPNGPLVSARHGIIYANVLNWMASATALAMKIILKVSNGLEFNARSEYSLQ